MNLRVTTYVTDKISGPLARRMAAMEPRVLADTVGPRLAELTQDKLASNPENKKGWPSTGFWEQAADSVTWKDNGYGQIMIQVAKVGVRQRYYGGPIVPKNVAALAIPISPVSYGHAPKEFLGLFLIKTPKGAYLVQYESIISEKTGRLNRGRKLGGNSSRRQRATLNFLFKLSFGVEQEGNRNIMPSSADYRRTAMEALNGVVTKILKS